MSIEMMSPFVEGTLEMMGSMLGLDCQVTEVDAELGSSPTVYGTVALQGNASGRITLSLAEADGKQLVGAMMGVEQGDVDAELMRDGLGEMANVIAGYARSVLAGADLDMEIGLPEIAAEAPVSAGGVIHRKVESDLGSFFLTLEILKNDSVSVAESGKGNES